MVLCCLVSHNRANPLMRLLLHVERVPKERPYRLAPTSAQKYVVTFKWEGLLTRQRSHFSMLRLRFPGSSASLVPPPHSRP